jgi:methionyl-tRNA synthetase
MTADRYPTSQPAVVTCGLPYANGSLHLGHLLTTLSGDALARALEALGQQTAFVCGSDMHGTPIAVNAHENGETPEAFARRYHEEFAETFPQFDIEFDNYGHTHDETNVETTRDFVETWIENDHVYRKEIKVAWDPEAGQPLPDRYVEGTCPYCGEHARGDECDEGCQRHLEPGEIEDPTSTLTGNAAEYRTRSHEFLRLSDFQAYLEGFIDRLEGTENAKNQPRQWIEGDLQDLCITRDMDWGIDYPGEGEEDLVLYVWVDAPIEYVSATKQYTEAVGADTYDWADVWCDDGEIVHVIGQDIIQHHAVFWPAMLRGAGYNEPRGIMASGFVNLKGKAFSTSRNRAIWAEEYLDTGFSPDFLRYYFITAGNFQSDINFTWEDLRQTTNEELVGNIGNFIYRSLLFAHRNYDGTPLADEPASDEVRERIEAAIDDFTAAINDYSLVEAARTVYELSGFGNQYIQSKEPWNLIDDDPDAGAVVIRDCVQLAKAVGVLLAPFAPEGAERVWDQLGEAGSVHDVGVDVALEAPPAEFGAPDEIFTKIEDDDIEPLRAELESMVEDGNEDDSDNEAEDGTTTDDGAEIDDTARDRIDFETFQDLEMRVGEIEAADPVEGADDLVRLEIDIGVETRQIVAGIKQFYDVGDLAGTRVVVLANLEAAELFGVESNGMLLAAGDEADLLTTVGDAPVGSVIR